MENFIPTPQTVVDPQESIVDPAAENYFNYLKVKPRLDRLISDWSCYRIKTIENRNARYIRLSPEELRQKGQIQQDETMIPCRIIDYNITRDKADAMTFLNSANRLAYFHCTDDPQVDSRQLESDFTKGLTYPDWYIDFDRHFDGAALHGWDSMEVEYDESKPLHVAINHIGFDKLIYNVRVRDIQSSSFLLLESEVTALDLEGFVKENGFDPNQVELMTRPGRETRNDDKVFCIYKVYFKYGGYVYRGWYSKETPVNNWLRAPECYTTGILQEIPPMPQPSIGASIIPMQEMQQPQIPSDCMPSDTPGYWEKKLTLYPVFRYTYIEDEQQCISDKIGRAFLDLPQQEAVTAITSGYVNSTIKASNVYASPSENDDSNRLEDITLEGGTILPIPIEFFHMPYPDPGMLQGLQYLDAANSKQTGKMAVSVSNRQDSRKTAKELSLAEQEQNKISSTSLATYNDFIRNLYSFAWLIIQSQALANKIRLLLKSVSQPVSLANPTPEVIWINDKETIAKNFDVRAAGEIDVLQKNELINNMMQDWAVIQNTPVAQMFLEDFLRLRYPTRADQYIAQMKAGDPGKQVAQSLLAAVTGLAQQDKNMNPQQRDQLAGIVNNATMYLNPPQPQNK